MPTKRTSKRTPTKQARTKTATGTTPEAAQRKPTTNQTADIPRTYELIIDAVAEILHSGGESRDVDGLLRATMAHTRRREASGRTDDATEQAVNKFVNGSLDDWKLDLATEWRKNKRPNRKLATPKNITELIRSNAREAVCSSFDAFMANSSLEEQRFLMEVLDFRKSRSLPARLGDDEIFIATAFETVINEDECFLRIPERMMEPVQQYIDTLRTIENKTAETPSATATPTTELATPNKTPLWVGHTPPDHSYSLMMFENDDAAIDEVDISRDEFIALKQHLAGLRGYITVDLDGSLRAIAGKESAGDGEVFSDSAQQIARGLLVARSIYRYCPEAVSADDSEFVSKLREISDEVVRDYRIV